MAPLFVAAHLFACCAASAQTSPAADDTDPIDSAFTACVEKDPSTAGMIGCAAKAEADWDKALNAAYAELLRELKGAPQTALREAQRAWVEQRNREFALQRSIHGLLEGTMWGPVMADQRVGLVKARTQQLRAYLDFLKQGRP